MNTVFKKLKIVYQTNSLGCYDVSNLTLLQDYVKWCLLWEKQLYKILTLYLLLCRYKNNDLNGWYTHLNSKEGKMNNLTAKVATNIFTVN